MLELATLSVVDVGVASVVHKQYRQAFKIGIVYVIGRIQCRKSAFEHDCPECRHQVNCKAA